MDSPVSVSSVHRIALLTGGSDKPYAVGLTAALAAQGVRIDFIGSNELDCVEVKTTEGVVFLNLRGDQSEDAPAGRKAIRVLNYYRRLITFAARARPRILHILWNNRFEVFDRTALMLYYRLLGKRVVLTAHNVNVAKRDRRDGWVNRLTLRIQYHLCNHLFVHTDRMKQELVADFGVDEAKVTVIPFGINNTIPTRNLTPENAKRALGVESGEKTLLFFGQIAPYKGLKVLYFSASDSRRDPIREFGSSLPEKSRRGTQVSVRDSAGDHVGRASRTRGRADSVHT